MDVVDKSKLLDWLESRRSTAHSDSTEYQNKKDWTQAEKCIIKASVLTEVIDHLTRS